MGGENQGVALVTIQPWSLVVSGSLVREIPKSRGLSCGLDQEVFQILRVGSGRVGSGRVRGFKSDGSGRCMTGRIGPHRPDPTREN